MALLFYLAMTAAEMNGSSPLPPSFAYMACRFSPCGAGLSNRPGSLPEGSLLILNDQTPICGHDPDRISQELLEILDANSCCGVLLDFQREGSEEAAALVQHLCASLPCPVTVSHLYAQKLSCPVFLPPVPPDTPLKEYLLPWQGREIWLEAAMDGLEITLKETGAARIPLPFPDPVPGSQADSGLHCHYHIHVTDTAAQFTLYRTREDTVALLEEAEHLGVSKAVGLWQEWNQDEKPPVF